MAPTPLAEGLALALRTPPGELSHSHARAQTAVDRVHNMAKQMQCHCERACTSSVQCRAMGACRSVSAKSDELKMMKTDAQPPKNGLARTTHPNHGPRARKHAPSSPHCTPPRAARRASRRLPAAEEK